MSRVAKRILINKDLLLRSFCSSLGGLFSVLSIFLTFFSFDNIGIESICCRLLFIFSIFVIALLMAVLHVLCYKKVSILKESKRSITFRYGDLWSFAFPKRSRSKRIVVINLNTAFDTIVDPPGVVNPLVSEKTIHGQWINQLKGRGVEISEIDKAITKSLDEQGLSPLGIVNRKRGKCKNYPKGTVACYTFKNTIFYLLALSEFDENNNAHSSKEDLWLVIDKLIEFIDKNGQGFDVFMPLMGTGKSRTDIDDDVALALLKSELLINKDKLSGNINVVVYEGNRDKISLWG